jgi:hypothetical protein
MNSISIADAILFLIPNSQFRIVEDDLSTLEFFTPQGQVHPTQAQVDKAKKDLEAARIKEQADKATQKAALLNRLGLSEDEFQTILG